MTEFRWLVGLLILTSMAVACGDDQGTRPDDERPLPTDVRDTQEVLVPDVDEAADTASGETIGADVVPARPCHNDEDCIGAFGELKGCNIALCELSDDGESGVCVLGFAEDGTECDDGNACTTAASCSAGVCVAEQGALLDCDDGNICTDSSCDPAVGCVHEPNNRLCDDGLACTVSSRCSDGVCVGQPIDCDDGNPCTNNVCVEPGGCRVTYNNAPCDNGNACTANDYCSEGTCRAGAQISCDDGNPCTDDFCHSIHGCRHVFNERSCDDGNPCTHGDRCVEGECVSGDYVPGCPACEYDWECLPYDDGNDCTGLMACIEGECRILSATIVECPKPSDPCVISRCDAETGECYEDPLPDGVACDDGDKCTLGDACFGGVCVGTPVICDDGNPCTENHCDPEVGCQHPPNDGVACDFGDPCVGGSTCQAGICMRGPDFLCVDCTTDDDCSAVDDGDLCTGVLRCYDGTCRLDPESVVTCDTSGDDACSETRCDPATGECVRHSRPDGTPCDDGLVCTLNDVCQAGVCEGTPIVCDDGNQCTEGQCDEATGGCVFIERDWPCDNGNKCTIGDMCRDGICVAGELKDCDDDNICTANSCSPTEGCIATSIDRPCDDGDACTRNDRCIDGECVGEPIDCDDGNPCTGSYCHPDGTCKHPPVAGPCDNGDICTVNDYCEAGVCITGEPRVCDDGNECTKGLCVQGEGCVFEPVEGPCSDGDACTTGDRCVDGECVPTGVRECDDENPCTDNTCDPDIGCVFIPNSDPCDNGNMCTENDVCVDGECVAGNTVNCDDGNVCTDNTCRPESGCRTVYNTAPCDAGNPCTDDDYCDSGQCFEGPNFCTEICDNGIDDRHNGLTDCDDPQCFDHPACEPCEPAGELFCGDVLNGSLMHPDATDREDSYGCSPLDFSGREFTYLLQPTCLMEVEIMVITRTPSSGPSDFIQLYGFALKDENDRCEPDKCIAMGTPQDRGSRSETQFKFTVMYDEVYYVVIDGLEGDEGSYELYVTCRPFSSYENCTNGVDDTCNGLTDCDDPDCFTHSACL